MLSDTSRPKPIPTPDSLLGKLIGRNALPKVASNINAIRSALQNLFINHEYDVFKNLDENQINAIIEMTQFAYDENHKMRGYVPMRIYIERAAFENPPQMYKFPFPYKYSADVSIQHTKRTLLHIFADRVKSLPPEKQRSAHVGHRLAELLISGHELDHRDSNGISAMSTLLNIDQIAALLCFMNAQKKLLEHDKSNTTWCRDRGSYIEVPTIGGSASQCTLQYIGFARAINSLNPKISAEDIQDYIAKKKIDYLTPEGNAEILRIFRAPKVRGVSELWTHFPFIALIKHKMYINDCYNIIWPNRFSPEASSYLANLQFLYQEQGHDFKAYRRAAASTVACLANFCASYYISALNTPPVLAISLAVPASIVALHYTDKFSPETRKYIHYMQVATTACTTLAAFVFYEQSEKPALLFSFLAASITATLCTTRYVRNQEAEALLA